MKKNKLYLLLFIPIIALLLVYIRIEKNASLPLDLYELVPGFYIKKIDYFSKYTIVEKTNDDFYTIVSDVDKLYIYDEKCLIKYSVNSKQQIMYLSDKCKEPLIADSLKELIDVFNSNKIIWSDPRKIVESKTLRNPEKLNSQIILILIILLLFYMIMKVFNLRGLIKAHNKS